MKNSNKIKILSLIAVQRENKTKLICLLSSACV